MTVFPIVFTCDNNYFKYTNIVITSLIANRNKELKYKIHILSEDLTEENEQIARKQIADVANFSIEFHILKGIKEEDYYLNSYMSISTYYRFFIASIFPQYDRILYLDSDLIVENDIAELATISFEDKLGIAASSPYIKSKIENNDDPEYPITYFTEVLKMSQPENYFNAGVILFNLKMMRERGIQSKLFQTLKDIPNPKLQDQDILNAVFANNGGVKLISTKYNYTPVRKITVNRLLIDGFKKKLGIMKSPWFYIYHYVGRVKPWQKDNGINTSLFYKYAYQSPFFDHVIRENGLNIEEITNKYKLKLLSFF